MFSQCGCRHDTDYVSQRLSWPSPLPARICKWELLKPLNEDSSTCSINIIIRKWKNRLKTKQKQRTKKLFWLCLQTENNVVIFNSILSLAETHEQFFQKVITMMPWNSVFRRWNKMSEVNMLPELYCIPVHQYCSSRDLLNFNFVISFSSFLVSLLNLLVVKMIRLWQVLGLSSLLRVLVKNHWLSCHSQSGNDSCRTKLDCAARPGNCRVKSQENLPFCFCSIYFRIK